MYRNINFVLCVTLNHIVSTHPELDIELPLVQWMFSVHGRCFVFEFHLRIKAIKAMSTDKSPQPLYMDPGEYMKHEQYKETVKYLDPGEYVQPGQYKESSLSKDKDNTPNNGFAFKRYCAIAVAVLVVLVLVVTVVTQQPRLGESHTVLILASVSGLAISVIIIIGKLYPSHFLITF